MDAVLLCRLEGRTMYGGSVRSAKKGEFICRELTLAVNIELATPISPNPPGLLIVA